MSDNNIYSQDYKVNYYEIDGNRKATPSSIIQYIEDVSMGHSIQIGYGLDTLSKDNLCWIVNKWHVVMDRYPIWNEKITFDTWVCDYKRIFAKRDYRLKDNKGNVIGRMTARWIFFDYEKRKPVSILPEIKEGYGTVKYNAVEDDFKKIILPDKWDYEKKIDVRRSDIDMNLHVNNIKYLEWVNDTVPEDIYNNRELKEFEIIYNKESNLDADIVSRIKKLESNSNKKLSFIHEIYDRKKDINVASAITHWI